MTLIWGRITSINVRKVIWTLQELGLPFERKDAGAAFGVVHTDEYAQLNPNRLVPLMVQGERTLWESNVIVRYLCSAESRLCPTDPWLRADAERWMDWQQTTFSPAGRDAALRQSLRSDVVGRRTHHRCCERDGCAQHVKTPAYPEMAVYRGVPATHTSIRRPN